MQVKNIAPILFLSATSAWKIESGNILDNQGRHTHIRGCSWFGFETPDMVVNGLWAHPMDWYVERLKDIGVTTLRIPISTEWIKMHWEDYPFEGFVSADPYHQHMKARDILDSLFTLLQEAGIHVMLDMHRLDWKYISELWYDAYSRRFTDEDFHQAWFTILDEFGDRPNLMAVDLLNEPHGRATWGSGDHSTDWRLAAQETIRLLEERYPSNTWLYVVEGVGWGKDLSNAARFPLQVVESARSRVAYSAHNYGRSVVPGTPVDNVEALRRDWDMNFGVVRQLGEAVIIGEYGGRTDLDAGWMEHFTDYLIDLNATDAFFWSLGPNSGDVAGLLLDDWTTVDEFKAHIIQKLG